MEHRLAPFTVLVLTTTTTSNLLLPPLTLVPFNATTLYRESWPRAPWVQPMDESASIAIERYGRHVCSDGDLSCESRVAEGLEQIAQIVDMEYAMGRERIDSFSGGAVVLWFRQEKSVPKIVVEDLVRELEELMGRYGARELTHAGVLNYGTLAATFELTVPWISDE